MITSTTRLQLTAKEQQTLAAGYFNAAIKEFCDAENFFNAQEEQSSSMKCKSAFATLGKLLMDFSLLLVNGSDINMAGISKLKKAFLQQLDEVDKRLLNVKAAIDNDASVYNELLQANETIFQQGKRCFCMAYLKYAQNEKKPVKSRVLAADAACQHFRMLSADWRKDSANFYDAIAEVYGELSEMFSRIEEKIKCIQAALNALENTTIYNVHRKNDLILALLDVYEHADNKDAMSQVIQRYSLLDRTNLEAMPSLMRLRVAHYCEYVAQDKDVVAKAEASLTTVAHAAGFFSVPGSSEATITRKRKAEVPIYDADAVRKRMRVSALCNDENEERVANSNITSPSSTSP